jgi:succinate-semialdehyde dehydrogenase / glutarate-semialdehyde dehydrogenase
MDRTACRPYVGSTMQSVNPATGEPLRDYDEHGPEAVERAVSGAREAFPSWSRAPFGERAAVLRRVAALLRDRKAELGRLMTLEMGKPLAASESEIDKCASAAEFYAENAERFLAPERIETDAHESFVRYDALGPVLAVMPWNFPFWQVFRFAAPALMAGNVGLLKHASNVPGCALEIEALFRAAGAPSGVFSTLLVGSSLVERLLAHRAVMAATLTGSEAAGRSIAAAAGKHLKKVVLELGGSDPFIVLADADVDAAAAEAVKARTINSGQSCIAAKRFIVAASCADAFEKEFVSRMRALKVGDPLDRATDVGPLAREDLVTDLDAQVRASVGAGAKLLLGGERIPGPGFYYAPSVLAEVTPGMPAFDDETFGPVAALCRARDDEEAIELANRSRFGLGASIWTRDRERAKALAARVESGVVFVNGMVKSDPRVPFGGIKDSGFGRELGSHGIREFVNVKTVWVV